MDDSGFWGLGVAGGTGEDRRAWIDIAFKGLSRYLEAEAGDGEHGTKAEDWR